MKKASLLLLLTVSCHLQARSVAADLSVTLGSACAQCSDLVIEGRRQGWPFSSYDSLSLRDLDISLAKEPGIEQRWRQLYGGFDFVAIGSGYSNYFIRAKNQYGGRSFIYDPRVIVVRLESRSEDERKILGDTIQKFFAGVLTVKETRVLFLSINYEEGIADYDKHRSKRHLAGYLGDFLSVPSLQDFVLTTATTAADLGVRLNVLKSVLSALPSLDANVRGVVMDRLSAKGAERTQEEADLVRRILSNGPEVQVEK